MLGMKQLVLSCPHPVLSSPEKKRLKVSEDFSSCLSEEQPQSPTLKGEDIQALAIRPEDLEKVCVCMCT